MTGLSSIIVLAVCFGLVLAYPSGAPKQACNMARPLHTTNGVPVQPLDPAQNTYRFTTDEQREYKPGETLRVTIADSTGGMVNGFFLQARRLDNNVTVGTFMVPLPMGSQLLNCSSIRADTVTHTNPDGKTGLTFNWQAPPKGTGSIQFVGAVARDHDNFFAGITSDTLSEGSSALKLSPCVWLSFLPLLAAILQGY